MVTKTYKRPYLEHVTHGHIITVQHKAWMDSPGVCMWVDVQLHPISERLKRKFFLVWDNCGPHNTDAVKKVFDEKGVQVRSLPPRMTSHLQVMDLVVNGPMKASMRKLRCEDIFQAFQIFKAQRAVELAKSKEQQNKKVLEAPFLPPQLTMIGGIKRFLWVQEQKAACGDFKLALKRTFFTACQAPDEKGDFLCYPDQHEVLQSKLASIHTVQSADVLSDLFVELCMEPRPRSEDGVSMQTTFDDEEAADGDELSDSDEDEDYRE
jgi:hypothetical protein